MRAEGPPAEGRRGRAHGEDARRGYRARRGVLGEGKEEGEGEGRGRGLPVSYSPFFPFSGRWVGRSGCGDI